MAWVTKITTPNRPLDPEKTVQGEQNNTNKILLNTFREGFKKILHQQNKNTASMAKEQRNG